MKSFPCTPFLLLLLTIFLIFHDVEGKSRRQVGDVVPFVYRIRRPGFKGNWESIPAEYAPRFEVERSVFLGAKDLAHAETTLPFDIQFEFNGKLSGWMKVVSPRHYMSLMHRIDIVSTTYDGRIIDVEFLPQFVPIDEHCNGEADGTENGEKWVDRPCEVEFVFQWAGGYEHRTDLSFMFVWFACLVSAFWALWYVLQRYNRRSPIQLMSAFRSG